MAERSMSPEQMDIWAENMTASAKRHGLSDGQMQLEIDDGVPHTAIWTDASGEVRTFSVTDLGELVEIPK